LPASPARAASIVALSASRCLGGDVADQLDDIADPAGGLDETLHQGVRVPGLLNRCLRDLSRVLDLPADLLDRGGELARCGRRRLRVAIDLFAGRARRSGLLGGAFGDSRHRLGNAAQLSNRFRHQLRRVRHFVLGAR
jgi:hypothetical protein